MFGQIPPTEFDLNFRAFGIPVRVHPVFWLSSVFLAWFMTPQGELFAPRLAVGIGCIFLAILVHELGHALMNSRFGFRSEIVLYFLGGYATSTRHSTWRDIAVSAAGPGVGLVLCGLSALMGIWLFGRLPYPPWKIPAIAPFADPALNLLLYHALSVSMSINLLWSIANLIPVEPLDGGQISRELWLRYGGRNGYPNHLILSMVVSGAVAAYCVYAMIQKTSVFGLDPVYLGLMFGYLCFQNYQTYERYRRGGGYW